MKNTIVIFVVIVLMTASFAAGWLMPDKSGRELNAQNGTGISKEINTNITNNAEDTTEDTEALSTSTENVEKVAKNVFFSPNTGNDETGDGSQWNPFKTIEKAQKHAKTINLADNEEICILEFLMSVDIRTSEAAGVYSWAGGINMIPFTGSTDGAYFKGEIVGTGYDTQKFSMGSPTFSARYLIKGKDYKGQNCSIFIENNGDALDKCTPTVITDSTALSDWQTYNLRTIVTPVGYGVVVDMYRIHD